MINPVKIKIKRTSDIHFRLSKGRELLNKAFIAKITKLYKEWGLQQ